MPSEPGALHVDDLLDRELDSVFCPHFAAVLQHEFRRSMRASVCGALVSDPRGAWGLLKEIFNGERAAAILLQALEECAGRALPPPEAGAILDAARAAQTLPNGR